MKSKAVARGLFVALFAFGTLTACGGESEALFLRPLGPAPSERVTVPVGTKWIVEVELSGVVGTETFVDIDNSYKTFVTLDAESVRFQPKDDPPKHTVELTAIKGNNEHLPIKFTLRGTTSVRTLFILPEAI